MSRFFAIVLTCVIFGASCDAKGYYTIVGSRIFRANSPYHISVSTHGTSEAVQMRVGVEGQSEGGSKFSQFKDVTLEPDTSKVVEIDIGNIEPGQYNLTAEGLSGIIFKNFTSIAANTKSFSGYIQTDKAVYKPGDKVRFRVVLLDANLKPVQVKNKEKMKIYIMDAKQNRIKQWLDAEPVKGVYSNELQLSDLPVLGDWTIQVDVMGQKFTKTVEVAEYVLPKFEVTIDTPKFATFKDGKLRFTVRSKYTYGKPVKGEATISVYPRFFGSYQPFVSDLISRKVAKLDGKASVEFDIQEELKFKEDWQRDITVEAVVEEELTNRKQNTSKTVTLYRTRYEVELIKSSDRFKAGLPFTVRVKVAHRDGTPVTDKNNPVYIRQTNNFNDPSGFHSDTVNSTVYLDENGMAKINVAIPTNVSNIDMVATYLDTEGYLGYTPSVSSESNTFLKTTINTPEPEVNREISVQVDCTEPMTHFTYQIIGRGDIIVSKTVEVPSRTSHTFKFLASFAMVPEAALVVYFVRPDGEIVSDKQSIKFRSSFQNFVKLELDKLQAGPGDDISLTVNTKPNSFVGLLGVDQSVLLLKSGNDLSKDDIFNDLRNYQQETWYPRNYPVFRRKRSFYPWSFASWRDFSDSGAVLLTNAKEEARRFIPYYGLRGQVFLPLIPRGLPGLAGPLPSGRQSVAAASSAGAGGFVEPPKIRKEFPENWIWEDIEDNGYEGKTTLHKKVPDTITSWVITGFAIDPITGFGMTQNPRTLNVFQPFFVSTNLPYSVKRGEVVSIPIVVFNYMENDVQAEVTLENVNQEFDFTEITNEVNPNPKLELYRKKRVSVPANGGKSLSFMITPKKVGHITIKVKATSAVAGDGVERMLLVEPEGVTQYMSKAVFMDLNKEPNAMASLPFEVPKNAVPDSTHAEVSVLGDLLGSTIENLDKLIKLPYGCGEQNMLNFVPNIVVLNYLKITGKQTPEIEKKALKYMESGYQRELTYKHKDGSFSAFGESDKSGSTWLTAFVAKSFRQAKKFISVEEEVITNALNWLSDQQAANGSFPEVGHVSHKDMQGGAGQGIALTAYTLITFLENRNDVPKHQNTINKALDYVARNLDGLDDVYALALATYALHIAQHSARSNALGLLESKATTEAQLKWWHKPIPETDKKNPYYGQPNSVNVELTAYALLTYMEAGIVEDALPVMKWLIGQRNSEGGFQSTQDTVVGITALAKFAEKVSSGGGPPDLTMTITSDNGQKSNLRINQDNSLVLQSVKLSPNVRNVTVSGSGKGFAVVQLSYRYNLNVTGAWPRFTLDPQVNKNSNQDFLHLSVCTSFIPDAAAGNESNMAVMEVGFPSGFTADLDTLPSLQMLEKVKKVETKESDTKVVLYFDNLDRTERCPTLTAFRTFKVAHQKPAAVTVYDYYDNARRARMFYSANPASLCDICEGEDCGDSCMPKAQQQTLDRAPDSILDTASVSHASTTESFTFLIFGSLIARFFFY